MNRPGDIPLNLTDAGRHLPDPPPSAVCPPGVTGAQEPNQ